MPLRILLGTNHLWSNTGSELTLLGFARTLAAKGHDVACFALMTSPKMAQHMRLAGLRLLQSRDEAAQFNPDAVYCQHHTTAAAIRGSLPAVPILLAHLGVEPELEQAPFVDCNIYRHLAISEEVRELLIRQGIRRWRITLLRNAVPAADFSQYGIARTGDKALLFSYRLSPEQRSVIREAVGKEGLQLDDQSMIASGQLPYEEIGVHLSTARVVFASGRSAIEAMMTGAPTVVVGPKGLDGAATPYRLEELAKANFSGRLNAKEITVESMHGSLMQALAADAQLTKLAAVKLFDVNQRSAELEHMCVCAVRKRHKQMKPRQLNRVLRFDRLLAEQRKMAVWQQKIDQQNAAGSIDVDAPHLAAFGRILQSLQPEDGSTARYDVKDLLALAAKAWGAQQNEKALNYYITALVADRYSGETARQVVQYLLVHLSTTYGRANRGEERKQVLMAFLDLQPNNHWALVTTVRHAIMPYDGRAFSELLLRAEFWSYENKQSVKLLMKDFDLNDAHQEAHALAAYLQSIENCSS